MLTNRQLFNRFLAQTCDSPIGLEIVRAEGIYLFSADGKKYMDLISGISVSNTGHRHPVVISAIKEQLDKYLHLMVYGEYIQTPQVKLASKLSGLLPPSLSNVYLVNSGSEAVEGALKLAKKHTNRSGIISFSKAYHGSTHGSLSIMGDETLKKPFYPLLPNTEIYPFNSLSVIEHISEKTACVFTSLALVIDPLAESPSVMKIVDSNLRSS